MSRPRARDAESAQAAADPDGRTVPDRPRGASFRPSRSRRLSVTAAVLVLLVGLLALADLGVAAVVRQRLNDALTNALPGATVSAAARGWPVSWQVATDRLADVRVEAGSLTLPALGRELRVDAVTADARGVRGLRPAAKEVRIESLSGVVRLSWAELSRQTGANLRHGSGRTMVVTGDVPVLGELLPGELTGELELLPGTQQIGLRNPRGTLDGVTVPPDVLSGLVARLSSRFSLPTVPGLRWTSIEATAPGVVLGFEGHDLVMPR